LLASTELPTPAERLEIALWGEIRDTGVACATPPPRPNAPIRVETIGETLIGLPLDLRVR